MKKTLLLCLLLSLALPGIAQKVRKPVKYSRKGAISLNYHFGVSFASQYLGSFDHIALLYEYHINAYVGVGIGTDILRSDTEISSIGIPVLFTIGYLNKRHRGPGLRLGVVAQLDNYPFLRPLLEYKVRIGFGRVPVFIEPNIFMTAIDGYRCTNGTYTCPSDLKRTYGGCIGIGMNLGFYPFKRKP